MHADGSGSEAENRVTAITRERAERIARAQPCDNCGEYSWKKVSVKPAADSHRQALNVAWQAHKVCGVCGAAQEVGIDEDGDVVYVG
jgi:transcription elongation factor Elf1